MTGQARVILRTSVPNLTISHEKDTKRNLTLTTTTLMGFYQRNCFLRYENLQTNVHLQRTFSRISYYGRLHLLKNNCMCVLIKLH